MTISTRLQRSRSRSSSLDWSVPRCSCGAPSCLRSTDETLPLHLANRWPDCALGLYGVLLCTCHLGSTCDDQDRRPAHVIGTLFPRNTQSLRPCLEGIVRIPKRRHGRLVGELRDLLFWRRGYSNNCCDSDRKSTRLNSSHLGISYAVFCLKKKKIQKERRRPSRPQCTCHTSRSQRER